MCRELFQLASGKLECPIKVIPQCHPKAHVDVYIVVKDMEIILTCSQCDHPISHIKVAHDTKRRRTARQSQ